MKIILYPFMVLAACGLALSTAAHGLALAGLPIPGGDLIWGLHVGVFAVWIPAVLASLGMTRHVNRKDIWKVALAGCPEWMRRSLYVLFGYAILNFILFIVSMAGQPQQDRKSASTPAVVRGFSGHWMIFYSAAFAILYSRIHSPGLYRERKCPQGHTSPPTASFCAECGHDFSHEAGNA